MVVGGAAKIAVAQTRPTMDGGLQSLEFTGQPSRPSIRVDDQRRIRVTWVDQ